MYPLKEWSRLSEKLKTLPIGKSDTRNLNRFMFSGAVPTDIDSLGRIVIPDFLKHFAGLKTKVVIIGVHERAEVWDEKIWQAYRQGIAKNADEVAEKLGDLGVF